MIGMGSSSTRKLLLWIVLLVLGGVVPSSWTIMVMALLPTSSSANAVLLGGVTSPVTDGAVDAGDEELAKNGRTARRRRMVTVQRFQPNVTVVEGIPAEHGLASLSDPNGTIWCNGLPTYWITGHQAGIESPWCLVNDTTWILSPIAALDPGRVDRHYCVSMDVNHDGLTDVICNTGAAKGHGMSHNELYLTQPNGTLVKVPNGHGLQMYPYMRNRIAATLRNGMGVAEYVFFGTEGRPRADGESNVHRMFRTLPNGSFPYFIPVPGPWEYLFEATCAVTADFTNDHRDDMVLCNANGMPLLVTQQSDQTFSKVPIPRNKSYMKNWRNVRISDVTNDGIVDLIVVTEGQPSSLYIFRGIVESPYFDFTTVYYQTSFQYASPNVEILDVNLDYRKDIYVVQIDETRGKLYCGPVGHVVAIAPGQVPPPDTAPDVLLIGMKHTTTNANSSGDYQPVRLQHSQPGCGWIAQRWDDTTMLLGQGSFNYPGFGLLLQW